MKKYIASALIGAVTALASIVLFDKPKEESNQTAKVELTKKQTKPRQIPTGGINLGTFRASRYYTPVEEFFDNWYDFYRAVRLEGHGITSEGLLCSYQNIKPKKIDSRCKEKPGSRGSVAYRSLEPIVGRSIAVDPEVIELGSAVRLEFVHKNERTCRTEQCKEWSGWYSAEDTGGAFRGGARAVDIYAGFGTERGSDGIKYSIAKGLPYRTRISVVPPSRNARRLLSIGYPRIRETATRHEFNLLRRQNRSALDLVASYLPQ